MNNKLGEDEAHVIDGPNPVVLTTENMKLMNEIWNSQFEDSGMAFSVFLEVDDYEKRTKISIFCFFSGLFWRTCKQH